MEYVEERFDDFLPTRGWFADYMSYTRTAEGSSVFQFFVALTILGAALKRKTHILKGHYAIHPGIQVLLVAPSGKARKTSTAGIGIKLLLKGGFTSVIADKTTPEGLIETLKESSQALVYAPELAVLLGRQKYNEGMVALLTSLFDSPEQFQTTTKNGGKTLLKDISISFLGASTSDWLISTIPADAFGGGFMSRLLFVVQEDTPRCFPIPIPPEGEEKVLSGLKNIVATVPPQFELSAKAEQTYSLWYISTRHKVPEDPKMGGYHERKPDHLLRMSLLLSLAEGADRVQPEHFNQALGILNYIEVDMLRVFKKLGIRGSGIDQDRVLQTLKACGGKLSYSQLMKKLLDFMSLKTFQEALTTLEKAGVIKQLANGQIDLISEDI